MIGIGNLDPVKLFQSQILSDNIIDPSMGNKYWKVPKSLFSRKVSAIPFDGGAM